jgi:hypothetical protein
MDIEAVLAEKALKKTSKDGEKHHKGYAGGHSLNGGPRESDADFETDSLPDT